MARRIIIIVIVALWSVSLVLSLFLVPAGATNVIPEYDDFMSVLGQDDLVSPFIAAATSVTYTAYPFYIRSPTGSSVYDTSPITAGNHREGFSGTITASTKAQGCTFGLIIKIPANTKSGYYSFVGFYPSTGSTSSNTTAGWAARSYASPVAPTAIVVSSAITPLVCDTGNSSYSSTIYIPAHTAEVYVYICAYAPFDYYSNNYYAWGGWVQSGAFVSFSAEESLTTITTAISSQTTSINSTINSQTTSVNNAISSQTTSVNNTINNARTTIANAINDGFDRTVQALADIDLSNPFSEFEDRYIENFQSQLEGIEQMLSPENTALPNNGDFVGFAQDIQDGLGISGSAFNASQFKDATSAFGKADAMGEGGPWEFFSQAVADSLAGGTSSYGVYDDDYIYAWMEESRRWLDKWTSY